MENQMNIKTTLAATALLILAGSAMAEQIEKPTPRLVSTLTRAEVQNAAIAAHATNYAVPAESYGSQSEVKVSTKTRNEVRAKAIATAANHHNVMLDDIYLGG
jgi:hypothetical protein